MTAQAERGTIVGGRYRLESVLGEGGMAVVWRAIHTNMDRPVALKLVRREFVKDEQVREMFVREARVGTRIGKNAHIVDFLDADVDEQLGVPFLAMELLSGEGLDARIKREGPLGAALVASVLEQLADALDQAHSAGVFHRDLKPQNLFLAKDAKQRVSLKVLDFGIAKLADTVTQSSTHVGTPAYSAPEQLGAAWQKIAEQKGKVIATQVSAATDIWALGLVAYEMLIGTPSGALWNASTLAELPVKVVLELPPIASERAGERAGLLPAGFDAWLLRCIDLDATKRFQSAGDAVGAILPALRALASVPGGAAPRPASIAPPAAASPTPPQQPQYGAYAPAPQPAPVGAAGAPAPLPAQPLPHGRPPVPAYDPSQQPRAWPHTPPPGGSGPADPRLFAWAAHHSAALQAPADVRFYMGWNPFQFLPPISHASRDARLPVRDATVYIAEVFTNDAVRRAAGEDRFIAAFVTSSRFYYRAALRSKQGSGVADGLGQLFDAFSAPPTLGDMHFERFFDLRFPTQQEGHMALPIPLRQLLVNAGFRGNLELRPGGMVVRRADVTQFDPVELDRLLEATRGIYNVLAP